MPVRAVGVAGCGVMGSGIAQVCASYGYEVTVLEVNRELLERGTEAIETGLARDRQRGRLGRKTGQGFFGYRPNS